MSDDRDDQTDFVVHTLEGARQELDQILETLKDIPAITRDGMDEPIFVREAGATSRRLVRLGETLCIQGRSLLPMFGSG